MLKHEQMLWTRLWNLKDFYFFCEYQCMVNIVKYSINGDDMHLNLRNA